MACAQLGVVAMIQSQSLKAGWTLEPVSLKKGMAQNKKGTED